MSDNDSSSLTDGSDAVEQVNASVRDGRVEIDGPSGSDLSVEITWDRGVVVSLFGNPVVGEGCRVRPGDDLKVELENVVARVDFEVEIAPNVMSATLCVKPVTGHTRRLAEAAPTPLLHLRVLDDVVQPEMPPPDDAMWAIAAAGVEHGIDSEAIATAMARPGKPCTVAIGTEPVPGQNGRLDVLVDFDALRHVGVMIGTDLLRIVPKVEGEPGLDVRGRQVPPKPVNEARLVCMTGVEIDEEERVVRAVIDGQPLFDGAQRIEVREELELHDVNMETGDINFCGSVHVTGNVADGRSVRARHALRVDGTVDRALLESGTRLEVLGAVMHSTLRAGGERAVAATLLERVESIPAQLDQALIQAGELMMASVTRGKEIPWGLAMQVVLERGYSEIIRSLNTAAGECGHAGEALAVMQQEFIQAAKMLQTVAIDQRSHHQVADMVRRVQVCVSELTMLVNNPADLTVFYMQSSQAESSGVITLAGPGAVDCRIVAWAGIRSTHSKAVIRGGNLVSHGPVDVVEIGTPSGARMHVQLGRDVRLDANLVRAGTLVACASHSHRFLADRTDVVIKVEDGDMDVSSFAA